MLTRLLITLILLTGSSRVWSQLTITGMVIADEDNSSLPGVHVIESGTSNKTITNIDGTFSLDVSKSNATLIFSAVGFITKEVQLSGKVELFIKMKLACNKEFFDSHEIRLYGTSGLINNPLGGQLEFTSPWIWRGIMKGSYSYQTNLNKNQFQNAQVELSHYISNCDFDIDFRWAYRHFTYENYLNSKANSFEADLNIRNIKLIAGYTNLHLIRNTPYENNFIRITNWIWNIFQCTTLPNSA